MFRALMKNNEAGIFFVQIRFLIEYLGIGLLVIGFI